MFCPKCGNQLPDGAKFCGSCGATLEGAPAPMAPGASGAIPTAQPGQVPGAAPAQAPYGQQPLAQNGGSNKNVLIVGGIVLVVVLIALVVGLVNCVGCGGGKGYGSQEQLMESVSNNMNKFFASNLDAKAASAFADGLINDMPAGAVENLAKQNNTSIDGIKAELSDLVDSSSISSIAPYLSMMEIKVNCYNDGQVSSSKLNSINADLAQAGVTGTATNAVEIGANMTVTLKEALLGQPKGTTQSQDLGSIGMYAVMIDGRWYLWGDMS